jgi:glycosyltransferase involved in cell wall biosynthesis
MNDFHPLVSIIIPVYNGANYLREAIDSALAQTYKDIEVLVINDGSKDGGATEAIALSYGNKIRYFHKTNGVVASALNMGIHEMKGDYFSWLSHDDVYFPNKIEYQIYFLANRSDRTVILYSDYDFIDSHSAYIRDAQSKNIAPNDFMYNLITAYPVHGCTTLIPKIVFQTVGTFDEQQRTTQDYDLWFRMARQYDFVFVDKILIRSRLHEQQGSVSLSDLCIREINQLLISFTKRLNKSEIKKINPYKNLPLFYLNLSRNFKKRGFTKAADFAKKKFYKSVFSPVLLSDPRLLLTFAKLISREQVIVSFRQQLFGHKYQN